MDFAALLDEAGSAGDPASVKASLPLSYVLEVFGIDGEVGEDGRVHARCPFHDDATPSFDVYGENLERWGCFPCGIGGDVFDLIQRLGQAGTFAEAFDVASGLLAEMPADWGGPTKAAPRVFDAKAAADRVAAAYFASEGHREGLDAFVSAKGYPFDPDWLRETFEVGAEGAQVVIPHYDRQRTLVGYKRRTAETKPIAAAGATFSALYGEWRDTGTRPVLLCEGESDVWVATFTFGGAYDVLGLPTGTMTQPVKFVERLAGRAVVLAFDGDDAGRAATQRWHAALVAQNCPVRIVSLPDGFDLASVPDIVEVVGRARTAPAYPDDALIRVGSGYARKDGRQGHVSLSNWTFTAERELVSDNGQRAYEGTVSPSGATAVLSSSDLSTKKNLVDWANAQGGNWTGSDRDAQVFLGMLQSIGPFLKTGRMASVAGLHDWHFVFPGGTIGPDYWQWVEPAGDVELAGSIHLVDAPFDVGQVHTLRRLHSRTVMDPILAWFAAAPLRSVLASFPFLAVTGSSGTGKSTLVRTMLRAFAGTSLETNLTTTTPYAVSAIAEATNGIPAWYDEFRPGARAVTIQAVRQILRDAFDGAASARGGTKDHWAKVTRRAATAPIIVSGEDAFDETSLVERTVSVAMPLPGRNPTVLAEVQSWKPNGLPYGYLDWLIGSIQLQRLWRFENYEAGPADLPTRNRVGLGVLDLGWRLLSRFVDEMGGADLGEADFSLIIGEAAEAATHSPIEDAIRWAIDEMDAQGSVLGLRGAEDVWVRVENFVEFVTKFDRFVLPGGATAVRKYLQQHYGAAAGTIHTLGTQKRAWIVPNGVARLLGGRVD